MRILHILVINQINSLSTICPHFLNTKLANEKRKKIKKLVIARF